MSAKTMCLKPAAGRRVVNPATMAPLPEAGEVVERTSYWIRRLNAGDVVEASASETSTTGVEE